VKQSILYFFSLFFFFGVSSISHAFPTGTVWIPTDEVNEPRRWRWDSQVFFTLDKRQSDTSAQAPFVDEGVTYGFFNNDSAAAEGGLDWWEPEFQDNLKSIHMHFKIATLEGDVMPSIALGVYDYGVKANTTDNNIIYLGIGKTWRKIGHIFLGYFTGNPNILIYDTGLPSNKGFMLGFSRPLPELSQKLSLLAAWQGSSSVIGTLNFGFKWIFRPDISFLVGYDIYNNRNLATRDTVTIQLGVGF
jgi:hypothetical protein